MTGHHLHLSATWVITADALSMAARCPRIVAEIENRCLGTLGVARNTPGVLIEWEVHRRAHEYTLEDDYLRRWTCSCGEMGGLTERSPEWVHNAWLRHVDRADHPGGGQPTGSIQRLPWQPGTDLPEWTYLAQCRVTRP